MQRPTARSGRALGCLTRTHWWRPSCLRNGTSSVQSLASFRFEPYKAYKD